MQLDQPLTEKEFDELDQFLLSERSSDDAMTMDTLHGYLTAIAIGPETIMPAEWLLKVWGEDASAAPKWKNAKEEERILNLIMRFMNEVLVTFEVAPKEFEPLFCEHEHNGDDPDRRRSLVLGLLGRHGTASRAHGSRSGNPTWRR